MHRHPLDLEARSIEREVGSPERPVVRQGCVIRSLAAGRNGFSSHNGRFADSPLALATPMLKGFFASGSMRVPAEGPQPGTFFESHS